MTDSNVYSINKKAIARNFGRARTTYDNSAKIHQEISERLIARLLDLKDIETLPEINHILDLGGGTGASVNALSQLFPQASIVNLDLTFDLLAESKLKHANNSLVTHLCTDAEHLPLANHSVDLIFSNTSFHWCYDHPKLFQEIKRVLKPQGILLFSLFGQDTLKELKDSFLQFSTQIHVNPFLDMHQIGDLLIQQRFADPVMDMEFVTLTYKTIADLFKDIKEMGENTLHKNTLAQQGLSPKALINEVTQAYERHRTADHLPATFEIIYGFARGV